MKAPHDPVDVLADAIARRPEGFMLEQEWALRTLVVMLLGRDPRGVLDAVTDGGEGLYSMVYALDVLDVVRPWMVTARHHFGLLVSLRRMPRVFAQAAKDCRAELTTASPATATDDWMVRHTSKACVAVSLHASVAEVERWVDLCFRSVPPEGAPDELLVSLPARFDHAMLVCDVARAIVEATAAALPPEVE